MADTEIEYCILNISSHPHPEGVYISLLDAAAMQRVRYWGAHYATISKPVRKEEGLYQGRLACWVEIDTQEPAVLLENLEEVGFNDLNINIPDNVGFNSRIFLYTLRSKDHRLFVETKNEFGKTISAGMIEKIIRSLVTDAALKILGSPDVEVTLIPEEDALAKVFAIPLMKHIKITLVMPNGDEHSDDADEVIREMTEQNARRQEIRLSADPKQGGLVPNEQTLKRAAVAEHNGHVEADGTLSDGTPEFRSTKWYARIIKTVVSDNGSLIERALRIAKETVLRNSSN